MYHQGEPVIFWNDLMCDKRVLPADKGPIQKLDTDYSPHT